MSEQQDRLSVSGYLWCHSNGNGREAAQLVQTLGVSPIVAEILASRHLTSDTATDFLTPKIQTLMPDPSCLKGMDTTADRLATAVMKGEPVGIIGDYDVDGATSSAVLRQFLEFCGVKTAVHIPDRDEGYGPSLMAFDEFSAQNIRLVVTVDCGTTAFDVLDQATKSGFDVLVIDHHEAETRLPNVLSVVNPKRMDADLSCEYLAYMAAVGVVFLTVVAVQRALRQRGFFEKHPQPNLMNMLDMVALGTVCDVVPLVGLNRAYVRQGLKVMATRQNLGIKALCDVAKIAEAPTSYHLGYILGPRINAGGRVGEATCGHRLLCAQTKEEAEKIALNLDGFNTERKDIEEMVLLNAIEQVETKTSAYPIAFAYGSNWHQGVIGIVAGKLKERYNLPSFVMSIEADEVKGSARSVAGVDLGALIMAAKEKGLLTKGGGHTMAAGFSLTEDQIKPFYAFAGQYVQSAIGGEKPIPELQIDGYISASGATERLAEELQRLEPFGAGNPEPRLVLENVGIIRPSIFGNGHVRCLLASDRGSSVKAIAFRCADTAVGQALLNGKGDRFNVAGSLRCNVWQGVTSVQFLIDDLMRVE